jgi:imidazolonepropionase-like amidohydrolase
VKRIVASSALVIVALVASAGGQTPSLVIAGATLIDGAGGAAVPDAVVVVKGTKIEAAGPRTRVAIPAGARTLDARGKYIGPGFIDTNVHLSLYGGTNDRYETLVRYFDRQNDIVLEAAQIDLRHGITTVRDSYGMLVPLTTVRDRINRGEAVGPRILAAGNIVGWGGPYSISFSLTRTAGLTLFQEQMDDAITQGAGEEWMGMTPTELARAVDAYLDKGPDFIKYGGTSHFADPTFIGFSPEAQKVIVDRAHARGKPAETHATSAEGLRLAIAAGIDLIQHPEILDGRELPDDLVATIRDRKIVCSMLVSTMTGEVWQKHLKDKKAAEEKLSAADAKAEPRPKTMLEHHQRENDLGLPLEMRRQNAMKLIRAGAIVTPGTDSYWAAASELSRTPKSPSQDHGNGTIAAIEGLVELGMTPAQAIVAATKNGAFASHYPRPASDAALSFGTIQAGKDADLVVLDADPIGDIHNIRKVSLVIKGGRQIERTSLPEKRVLSRPATTSSTQ